MDETDSDRFPAEVEDRTDLPAGALFVTIGTLGLVFSRQMAVWRAGEIQSGFVPTLVSSLLILFGLIVLLQGLRQRGRLPSIASLRPLVVVTACVVLFAFTVERLGLVFATMLTVFLSTFACDRPRVLQSLVVGTVLSFACVAIFIWGAKLPLNAWPF
ncbi:hypothetical protein CCR97_09530 [Rhodoplanes elegans]|uniref:DUF1468 domain-containing protein n=1 Tax=Rhodoplanes elegans TaxID=29408 RepID=A0A327KRT7_9BRAD|nr:tripartite tricarboxylate transporter TctB family protein [Rhodoplanes elegans]MBK5958447.1 hypothetical protein [Rhodoplanes elegans]RAI41131.1 hypothetical protein CH338_03980 [Rhodoplanes elegans]